MIDFSLVTQQSTVLQLGHMINAVEMNRYLRFVTLRFFCLFFYSFFQFTTVNTSIMSQTIKFQKVFSIIVLQGCSCISSVHKSNSKENSINPAHNIP